MHPKPCNTHAQVHWHGNYDKVAENDNQGAQVKSFAGNVPKCVCLLSPVLELENELQTNLASTFKYAWRIPPPAHGYVVVQLYGLRSCRRLWRHINIRIIAGWLISNRAWWVMMTMTQNWWWYRLTPSFNRHMSKIGLESSIERLLRFLEIIDDNCEKKQYLSC